jgi:hypothetical protein
LPYLRVIIPSSDDQFYLFVSKLDCFIFFFLFFSRTCITRVSLRRSLEPYTSYITSQRDTISDGLNTNKRHRRAVKRTLICLTKKLIVRPQCCPLGSIRHVLSPSALQPSGKAHAWRPTWRQKLSRQMFHGTSAQQPDPASATRSLTCVFTCFIFFFRLLPNVSWLRFTICNLMHMLAFSSSEW